MVPTQLVSSALHLELKISMFFSGTLKSTCQLVKSAGADVLECVVIVQLVDLNGKANVPSPCFALTQF